MNETVDALSKIVPPAYQKLILAAGILIPVIGRTVTALRNNGGIVGAFRSVVMGSTTVHNLDGTNIPVQPTTPKQ